MLNISDDILIYATTEAEHNERLRATLQRLREKNLTLNSRKCEFAKTQTEFYGYVFSAAGMAADPKKILDIQNAGPPKSVAEVRSFLGMVTYVSRFIPNMATIAKPHRRFTKSKEPWEWGQEQSDVFEKLKECLVSAPVMAYFDTAKPTMLVVDASPVGLGAMLVQDGKVVSYASRSLSDVETRYSQTEREALAILWGCNHFHIYVYG